MVNPHEDLIAELKACAASPAARGLMERAADALASWPEPEEGAQVASSEGGTADA